MSLKFQESFRVDASPERVWGFLVQPERVVRCVPGAELTQMDDERHFTGRFKVKVGPVTAAYAGRAEITKRDDASRHLTLVGQGTETGGAGSVRVTLTCAARAVDGARPGTHVMIDASVDVAGRIVQFGRGLMELGAKQVLRDFVASVQTTLETPDAATAPAPAPALRLVGLVMRALKAMFARLRRRP